MFSETFLMKNWCPSLDQLQLIYLSIPQLIKDLKMRFVIDIYIQLDCVPSQAIFDKETGVVEGSTIDCPSLDAIKQPLGSNLTAPECL